MALKYGWPIALALALAGCGGGGGSEIPAQPARTEAAGVLDTAFGAQGLATFGLRLGSGIPAVMDIAQVNDGGYIVGGPGPYLAKFTNDGRLDASFAVAGIDTQRRGTKLFQDVAKVAPLADGSIMVVESHSGGCFGSPFSCGVQSFADVVARRTTASGFPDLTYGLRGLAMLEFSEGALVVSPNGRVTAFTMRPELVAPSVFAIASLDPAGFEDAYFEARALASVLQCGAGAGLAATQVASAASAAIGSQFLVATTWAHADDESLVCVSRLNADGSVDASFASGGHQTFVAAPGAVPTVRLRYTLGAFRVLPRDDGGTVVVLSPPAASRAVDTPVFLFLTASGAKDEAMGPSGVQMMPVALNALMSDVTLQPNGKIVDVGFITAVSGLQPPEDGGQVARSTPSAGLPDFGFGPRRGGYVPLQTTSGNLVPKKVLIDRTGAILVGGYMMGSHDGAVLRLQ